MMPEEIERITATSLRFFGRLTAAISHDLKNTLSIMNESAGLLEDLSLLAEKGRPLDPQRVQQLGASIKRQIKRNDGIVRNLNRFAHSVDAPFKEISLMPALEMLLAISQRLTTAWGASVSLAPLEQEVSIVTRPFYFFHLVWLILEWGMDYAGPGKRVILQIESTPPLVRLTYRGLESLTSEAVGQLPRPQWQDCLKLLGASLEMAIDQKTVTAVLPWRIDD